MFKPRQNAPFGGKGFRRANLQTRLDKLDRHALLEQSVVALAFPHFTHAARADVPDDRKRAEAFGRRQGLRVCAGRQFGGHRTARRACALQRRNPCEHRRAFVFQQARAKPCISRMRDQPLHQGQHALLGGGIGRLAHVGSGSGRPSRSSSHSRAAFQRRSTVRCERPVASTVSATLSPSMKRSSTIRA